MAKRKNTALAASRFAGSAFRDLNDMKRALQSAEASLVHLNRNFRVPVIRPPGVRTRRTTSQPSQLLSMAGLTAGNAFLDDFSGELGGTASAKARLS